MLFVCLLVSIQQTKAQENGPNNYIVITQNIQQLNAIVLTANTLYQEDKNDFGVFEIVVCGKAVKDLDNDTIDNLVKNLDITRIKIHACGLSLQKFNMDNAVLKKPITIVENGLLYTFRKQQSGYYSIEL